MAESGDVSLSFGLYAWRHHPSRFEIHHRSFARCLRALCTFTCAVCVQRDDSPATKALVRRTPGAAELGSGALSFCMLAKSQGGARSPVRTRRYQMEEAPDIGGEES